MSVRTEIAICSVVGVHVVQTVFAFLVLHNNVTDDGNTKDVTLLQSEGSHLLHCHKTLIKAVS